MKKTFVFLMTVFAILCFMTVSASADGISWHVDAEGTLTISGSGAMEDYASASAVPWASEDIYAVAVDEGVTHVGSYAFSGLFLDNVLLPESLESIGENAFNGAAITEAHYAGNLKQWEKDTIIGSSNDALKEAITCDKDVTYQGEGFSLAYGIVTSTVPELPSDFKREYNDYVFEAVFVDVTEIGNCSCGGYENDSLTNMTSVSIPDSVTSIGDSAFYSCSSLTNLTIPDGVTSIGTYVFRDCIGLTSVMFGKGVTSIGDSAFYNCNSLSSVTLPDSVTSIGANAFSNCSGLTSVTIPDSVTSIGADAFSNCSGLTSVTIPDSVTSIGDSAFYNCSSLTNLTIPDNLTCIGRYTFSCCNSLTSLAIPDGVTNIEEYAFEYCYGLTSVTIPDSVTFIGKFAFFGCSKLTSVTIPDGVTSVRDYVFCECNGMRNVTIPDSVTSIGNMAFSNCYLQNVYYKGTTAMWDEILIGDGNNYLISATKHCAVAVGETGDCHWSLSESGTLTISGNGRMADYAEGTEPWYAYRELITAINIIVNEFENCVKQAFRLCLFGRI